MSEVAADYRLKEFEKEIATLEGQRGAIQAECDEAPSMPTDALVNGLERSIRGAAEEARRRS
jgi:hypothetical protein